MIPKNIGIGNTAFSDRLREFLPLSSKPSLCFVPIIPRHHVTREYDKIGLFLIENRF